MLSWALTASPSANLRLPFTKILDPVQRRWISRQVCLMMIQAYAPDKHIYIDQKACWERVLDDLSQYTKAQFRKLHSGSKLHTTRDQRSSTATVFRRPLRAEGL